MHRLRVAFGTKISMNYKNDKKILFEIKNCFKDKQFFSNRLGTFRFILNKEWYLFEGEDKEKCVQEYIEVKIAELAKKENPKNERIIAEINENKDKYLEKFGKNWDVLHKNGWTEREDVPQDAVIVVFDDKELRDFFLNNGNIVVFCCEKDADALNHIIAKFVANAGTKTRVWSANVDLGISKFDRELKEKEVAPLDIKILPYDFEPSENDEPSLIELTAEQALSFRRLKTHNFVGSLNGKMLGVCINNMLCGVLKYSTVQAVYYGMDENMLFMQCAVGVNVRNKKYKISKFVDYVGIWEKACKYYLNDYEKEIYTVVGSSSISKYPENKSVRYIMEIANRTFDEKTQLYHILYKCDMKKYENIKEIYLKWLKSIK